VIPTTYGGINKSRAGDSHSRNPKTKNRNNRKSLPESQCPSIAVPVLSFRLCLSFRFLSFPERFLKDRAATRVLTVITVKPSTKIGNLGWCHSLAASRLE
jgi:hypothetical protein